MHVMLVIVCIKRVRQTNLFVFVLQPINGGLKVLYIHIPYIYFLKSRCDGVIYIYIIYILVCMSRSFLFNTFLLSLLYYGTVNINAMWQLMDKILQTRRQKIYYVQTAKFYIVHYVFVRYTFIVHYAINTWIRYVSDDYLCTIRLTRRNRDFGHALYTPCNIIY